MSDHSQSVDSAARGKYLVLWAALLGWMFDGFEMGLFPVIARPALSELLRDQAPNDPQRLETLVAFWNGLTIAGFLIGAAVGGVLFGWLGDRIGRVRAMALSILTYALLSGLGAWAGEAWHIVVIRFLAALGMGGEWALGVALVMEVWEGRSRAVLAGLIGAVANAGYAGVAVLSLLLSSIRSTLHGWGLSDSWVEWRALMLCGVFPALLTCFVRWFIPESATWQREQQSGSTKAWATTDLLTVAIGVVVCWGILGLWSWPLALVWRLLGTVVALGGVAVCFLFPVGRYLQRSQLADQHRRIWLRRMVLGAVLSGIPLLGTWAAVQWAPTWADSLSNKLPTAKGLTQLCSSGGAIFGGFIGAWLGMRCGRRKAYVALCLASLASIWLFYWSNHQFNARFLATAFGMGLCTASFYGWLPLYLPELFPTRIRATGQGFSFNFGRILAAIGALQIAAIMGAFGGSYPLACSLMGSIYALGLVVIWLAPETHGQQLPD